jgi:ribonuclease-3
MHQETEPMAGHHQIRSARNDLSDLVEAIRQQSGEAIGNLALLRRALTHRSFSNEQPEVAHLDNERLEFLGDAILDFLAGDYLFRHYPEMQEGELTDLRAALVRTETLAELGEDLDLGRFIYLGKGEDASGGRSRPAILCDTFEAVVGALYLDRGLHAVRKLFEQMIDGRVEQVLAADTARDPKNLLQELTQYHYQVAPRYSVVDESGPDHAKVFTVEVSVGDRVVGSGIGSSKQKATQEAARVALADPQLHDELADMQDSSESGD